MTSWLVPRNHNPNVSLLLTNVRSGVRRREVRNHTRTYHKHEDSEYDVPPLYIPLTTDGVVP